MGVATATRLERAIEFKVAGEFDLAITELKIVLDEAPDCSEANRQLGLVYGFTGEFDESLALLARAVELDASNPEVLIDLAKTQAMLGLLDEAKAGFLAVLLLDPMNEVAQANLSFFDEV